jgi:hypothetical protein
VVDERALLLGWDDGCDATASVSKLEPPETLNAIRPHAVIPCIPTSTALMRGD